ncbi:MAG TPA: hypothetical protein VFK09_00800 [Gemmatimonadales bacterium]|nr:hypothetical protein [Gemmatimonadales bacterium]
MRAPRSLGGCVAAAAVTAAALACGPDPKSLDAGWLGGPPRAAARADSTPASSAAAASKREGRDSAADVAPRVSLGASTRGGERAAPAPKPATAPRRAAYFRSARRIPVPPPADLQASLLRLRLLQSNLYALGRTYTSNPDQLGYAPEAGVEVNIVWASNWGWAAVARDTDRPDYVCTMYVGAVPHSGASAGRIDDAKAGTPNCTASSESPGRWVAYPQLLTADSARGSLAQGAKTLMRHDLVKLILSQRTHRSMQGVYARRIDPMSLHYAWHPGVDLKIVSADANGWAAEATYDQWPGHSCVIWAGTPPKHPTTAGGRTAETEGEPTCDD